MSESHGEAPVCNEIAEPDQDLGLVAGLRVATDRPKAEP